MGINMYQYYNAHPDSKSVGDCVKRAISKAQNRDYKSVSLELNRFKKISGATKFNSNENWKKYFDHMGYTKMSFVAVKGSPRMNGYGFCQKYNKGVYILRMAKHLTVCIDGVIFDTWNCLDKCVYNAWKVK